MKNTTSIFILFFSILGCTLDTTAQTVSNSTDGYIYIKPLETTQKEFSEVDKIVGLKIFIDGALIMSTNNIEIIQNHIALDTYHSWREKNTREIKIIYTLADDKEFIHTSTKQTNSFITQSIYFLN